MARLRRLLETLSDTRAREERRFRCGRDLTRRFPLRRRTDLYARLLREASLKDPVRWTVMLMLFYVGNEAAVRGLSAFVRDPSMPMALKSNAVMLLASLNGTEALRAAESGARFLIPWLQHGERLKEPRMPDALRRRLVIEGLLIDLFDEKEETS